MSRLVSYFLGLGRRARWLAIYHAVCCVGSFALACLRRDWSWGVVAAFNASATLLYLFSDQLSRAKREGILGFCPAWMATPSGQLLARRVAFVGRRWKRNMDKALELEAFRDFAMAQLYFLQAANRWAFSTTEEENHKRVELMAAWCKWRNAGERHHRAQEARRGCELPLPLYLEGMPRLEELFPDAKVPDVH